MRWNSFWGIALLLLIVLLIGAAIEAAFELAGIGQPGKLWLFYLAAHSCCYALLVTAGERQTLGRRLLLAASFAGACIVGAIAFAIAAGFVVAGSRMVEALTVAPLAMITITALLMTFGAAAGLGYGLCVALLQGIWFSHLDDFRLSTIIQHVIWGLVAPAVVGIGIVVAKLVTVHQPAMTVPTYLAVVGLMWVLSVAHLEVGRRTVQQAVD